MAGIVAAPAFRLSSLLLASKNRHRETKARVFQSVPRWKIPYAPFVSWLGAQGLKWRLFVQDRKSDQRILRAGCGSVRCGGRLFSRS